MTEAQEDNLLHELGSAARRVTKSERRIVDVILDDPRSATRLSIAALAEQAEVSEPTVNRFCRKFEPRGYPEFKLRLAQSLVLGLPYVSSSIAPDDEAGTYTAKILDSAVMSFRALGEQLPPKLVESVVDRLLDAHHIFFFGLGISSAVAQDAEHHFFRFSLPVTAHADVLMQRMHAAAARDDDVFFIISHTGRTRDLVDIANLATARGATVVALTAAASPLAKASSLAIELEVSEDTDAYMPMTSRLAHLVVLDVLAAGVSLRRGEALQPHLRAIKESLRATRFAPQPGGKHRS
ncbi:transcriptional regulator HexR [Congregibacter brevis]|uniref:Transcriptional regulator HexR n=1 Tax=Congregibacter brevis TaxID=3081201 RepID=A0ABZ0I9N1_9GAMM|nr:transcriptional regulator HexR [Congregibacter sp. IMCC45268]